MRATIVTARQTWRAVSDGSSKRSFQWVAKAASRPRLISRKSAATCASAAPGKRRICQHSARMASPSAYVDDAIAKRRKRNVCGAVVRGRSGVEGTGEGSRAAADAGRQAEALPCGIGAGRRHLSVSHNGPCQ